MSSFETQPKASAPAAASGGQMAPESAPAQGQALQGAGGGNASDMSSLFGGLYDGGGAGGGAPTTEGGGGGSSKYGFCFAPNDFGSFDFMQENFHAPTPGDTYASDVKITFNPAKKTVQSDEIAFVQNVRILDEGGKSFDPRDNFKNRKTKDEWTIDRLDNRKSGFYGYNNDGKPSGTVTPGKSPSPWKAAEMTDRPSFNKPNTRWEFETEAISKSGSQAGQIYAGLTWGFRVNDKNQLTSIPAKQLNKATAEFHDAVDAWNKQAEGPEAKRNHKDQEKLGPFTQATK
jgi:hypothetical protein